MGNPPKQPVKKRIEYPRKCAIKFCRKSVRAVEKSDKCSRHRAAQWKQNSPLKYHYGKLRNRAKERGHQFTLSFLKYEALCIQAGWITDHRGKTGEAYSINRKDSTRGYHDDNVEILTMSQNRRQHYVDMRLSESDNAGDGQLALPEGDNPF